MNTNKIIEKAKESYDRYFKDAPVFPENHEQDVVCNAEEIEKIIDKKKAQLDGHVENLNALKKEIEVTATEKLNKTFTEDAVEYAKKAVNQMLADYEEENNRIADLKKKLATLLVFFHTQNSFTQFHIVREFICIRCLQLKKCCCHLVNS